MTEQVGSDEAASVRALLGLLLIIPPELLRKLSVSWSRLAGLSRMFAKSG